MTYYTTRGDTRGCCGHKHKTVRTAFACKQRDVAACRLQDNYSDRGVVGVEDGEEFHPVLYGNPDNPPSEREERLYYEIAYLERQYRYRSCH